MPDIRNARIRRGNQPHARRGHALVVLPDAGFEVRPANVPLPPGIDRGRHPDAAGRDVGSDLGVVVHAPTRRPDPRAVFDCRHRRRRRRANPRGAVTVGSDVQSAPARFADDCHQYLDRKLRRCRVRADGEIAARRHHLDQVRPFLHLSGEHDHCRVEVRRLATPKMAVPFDRGNRLTGAQQPRTDQFAIANAIANLEFQPAATAEIPGRRDSGPHHRRATRRHCRAQFVVGFLALCRGIPDLRIQAQMHVRIDQARHERRPGEIALRAASEQRRPQPHCRDPAVFDANGVRIGQIGIAAPVPDPHTRKRCRIHGSESSNDYQRAPRRFDMPCGVATRWVRVWSSWRMRQLNMRCAYLSTTDA